jgi:PadR family transcriptional regulator PadR
MIAENTQTQMRKGILEYCILSIISKGEIYASDIISELKKAELLVVEGTLYPLLTRLKNNGLLSYSWKESTSGPPRKYYQITIEGTEVLEKLDITWKELVYAVETSLFGRK